MMDERIKILCVDDEQNVLNSLRRLFLDEDYEVLTANSGPDGLALQQQEHAQIIISDYRMPGMTGVEFLREVNKTWPHTVRIVLSGYADTASIVSAINEGQIYKFIPKPWNDDELKVTVANAIERYFLAKRNRELTEELKEKNIELERLLEERTVNLEQRSRMLVNFQNIINAIPVGVLGVDGDGIVVMANHAWIRMLLPESELLGEPVAKLFPPEVAALPERVRKEGRVTIRTTIQTVPGVMIGSLLQGDHEQEGVIIVFIDEEEIA